MRAGWALGLAALGLAALAAAGQARAQVCTATASGLAFGSYDPFAAGTTAITGTVTVTCRATVAVNLAYSVQLAAGTGGSFAARSMGNGTSRLAYQLYTNPALTQVWGDGTGGTSVMGDGYQLMALATVGRTYTAYGRIPARQVVTVGAYADTITVMVVY